MLLVSLLPVSILTKPIFLFGGPLTSYDSPAYSEVIAATKRTPKDKCDPNWFSTDCPRVAVVTSGATDSEVGNKEYFVGGEGVVPFEAVFRKLGTLTKHVSVHIDNYMKASEIMSE